MLDTAQQGGITTQERGNDEGGIERLLGCFDLGLFLC